MATDQNNQQAQNQNQNNVPVTTDAPANTGGGLWWKILVGTVVGAAAVAAVGHYVLTRNSGE